MGPFRLAGEVNNSYGMTGWRLGEVVDARRRHLTPAKYSGSALQITIDYDPSIKTETLDIGGDLLGLLFAVASRVSRFQCELVDRLVGDRYLRGNSRDLAPRTIKALHQTIPIFRGRKENPATHRVGVRGTTGWRTEIGRRARNRRINLRWQGNGSGF